ncbi:MAG: hypothetical protein HY758_06015 [Nitrospirae bacterium]|nr:hypothetical protein [Nitrospirota bacterium]
MNELDKLKHLIEHWMEHNEDHVKTYAEWALKAESMGKKELSAVLREIAEDNKKLEALFKKALKNI